MGNRHACVNDGLSSASIVDWSLGLDLFSFYVAWVEYDVCAGAAKEARSSAVSHGTIKDGGDSACCLHQQALSVVACKEATAAQR